MREIILLSGVSGSGKSTLVKQLRTEVQDANDLGGRKQVVEVVSTDDYFTATSCGGDATYKFDANQLGEAHGQALRKFVSYLTIHDPDVLIVDNTNITALELAPYVLLANAYHVPVRLITVATPDLEVAAKRNTHGVKIASILAQSDALDSRETPNYWMLRESVAMPNSCERSPFWIDDIGTGI
jgi:predicted kinase